MTKESDLVLPKILKSKTKSTKWHKAKLGFPKIQTLIANRFKFEQRLRRKKIAKEQRLAKLTRMKRTKDKDHKEDSNCKKDCGSKQ